MTNPIFQAADEWVPKPTCLDAAYERRAVFEGLNLDPVFPENKLFLTELRNNPDWNKNDASLRTLPGQGNDRRRGPR